MSSKEVRDEIAVAFKHIPIGTFQFMESTTGGHIFVSDNQCPDGSDLIEGVAKRKAVLYLSEVV